MGILSYYIYIYTCIYMYIYVCICIWSVGVRVGTRGIHYTGNVFPCSLRGTSKQA